MLASVFPVLFRSNYDFRPSWLPNLAAWYDVSDTSTLRVDGSNRVSLIADKSGNSATNCLCLNGVAGNYASTPDSAALSITGDIDIRARVALDDWTPSGVQTLVDKSGVDPNRSFYFYVNTSGTLGLDWYPTGSVASVISKQSTAAPTVSDFGTLWVRVTLDVDNGAGGNTVTFFTSSDGTIWTQLGNAVVTAGTTSIADTNAVVGLGARNAGASDRLVGRIYRAQIYNGIAGTLVFDANFATASKLATSFTESSSNAATVTINSSGDLGARISGERDLVQFTASKQPIYLPWAGSNYLYASSGGAFVNLSLASTGVIDLSGRVVYNPGVGRLVAGIQSAAGSSFGGYLALRSTGDLRFDGREDATGTGVRNAVSASVNLPALAAGQAVSLRVLVQKNVGGVMRLNFYYRLLDTDAWTELGVQQTSTAWSASYTVLNVVVPTGTFSTGDQPTYSYWAEYRDALVGGNVVRFDAKDYGSGTTFASGGYTWGFYGNATIVNRTSVYFDGSDDYMKAAAFSLSQPETVYFTGQQVSWTASDVFFDGGSTNGGLMYQRSSSPNIGMFAGADVGTNGDWPIATTRTVSGVFNGANSSFRVGRGTAVTGNVGSNNMNGFTLGITGNNATGPSNILTNEVCIYAAAHDTSVQDRVIQYGGRKLGISGV